MYGVRDHSTVVLEHAPSVEPDLLFPVPAALMPSGPRDAHKPSAATTVPLLRKAVTVVLTIDGTGEAIDIEATIRDRLEAISEVRRISIGDH
jgi:hypothetical protein